MSTIFTATTKYEAWLHQAMPIVEADLKAKHEELSSSVLRFLRGTYYFWLLRMPALAPALSSAPTVPLVGDLHAENFGTWRDHHGTARWGINDFDELGRGPYPVDLVRLATSCVLSPHVAVDAATICGLLLDTWHTGQPGHAVELASAEHLHALLPAAESDAKYYAGLTAADTVDVSTVPDHVVAAVAAGVDGPWKPTWHVRRAGTGSLGHPRVAAVDGSTAREVKLLGPRSAEWAKPPRDTADPTLYDAVQHALHGPSPASRVDGWQLRRLAPDVRRIEISSLHPHDTERVLRSMAQAVVDVHGVDAPALKAARADAAARPKSWLVDAVTAMVDDTEAAYHQWVWGFSKPLEAVDPI